MAIRSSLVFPKLLLIFLALTASALAAEPQDISSDLEPLRSKYKLPACAYAVVEGGHIIAIGAAGGCGCTRDDGGSLAHRVVHEEHDGGARRCAGG